jgi:type I restriction enzyme R subunit
MKVLRKADNKAQREPALKHKLAELHTAWGVEPTQLPQHLRRLGPTAAAAFLTQHSNLLTQLAEVKWLVGSEHQPVLSEHEDVLLRRQHSYGDHARPADYLESFQQFIKTQLNQSAALAAVVNKPSDLTRAQLKEVRLLLDQAGFAEATLRTAVRDQTNQDIAASIIGHIRQAALGEPLVPFEQRVTQAMQGIYQRHQWTPAQRKWLERLAKQLIFEAIIDRDFVNERFTTDGGAKRLDKVLGGQLDEVLSELREGVWRLSA